ncbi:MAG: SurA N-terminal domain-containing protein [Pseudomonadota bacterium]
MIRFFVLIAFIAASVGMAQAQSEQRIAVLVNNSAISEFDVRQRMNLMKLAGGPSGRTAAVNELIEERLKLAEAKRLGISVSDGEINQALGRIANQTGAGSVSRLQQALGQRGVNIRTLGDRFRAEIAWQQVVRQRFRQTIRIREQDVLAAIRAKGEEEEAKTTEFDLMQVTVLIPSNASNSLVSQRRNDAERIRSNISGCRNVRSVASAFRDVSVRDVGRRNANQMPPEIAEQMESTAIGAATSAQRSGNGFDIVVVCDKREVTGFDAARSPMESEMRNQQGQILARKLLRDLRADAVIDYR